MGIDIDESRLGALRAGAVDLPPPDLALLSRALERRALILSSDPAALSRCQAVMICVPTPIDDHMTPDLSFLTRACEAVVANATAGQTIVLVSTTYVGATRELLAAPLAGRGFTVGRDVFVAFSPERLVMGSPAASGNSHPAPADDGSVVSLLRRVPRVVGGVTPECGRRAAGVLEGLADTVHHVTSPEAAELTKIFENSFRAVNIALANEFADISRILKLDAIEVLDAAATKPYGFMAFHPGPGAGGHCIPCDPHYLLWHLRRRRASAPLIETAMKSLSARPLQVVQRAVESLAEAGRALPGARVLVVGVAFKPGLADVRQSTALDILDALVERGAHVEYHDPLVPVLRLRTGDVLASVEHPEQRSYDLVVVHTLHPGADHAWVQRFPTVLDATYRLTDLPHRVLL